MKKTILRGKRIENLKYSLIENKILTYKNYSIKQILIKGNKLLKNNSELSTEVFDTLKKAENKWVKIK